MIPAPPLAVEVLVTDRALVLSSFRVLDINVESPKKNPGRDEWVTPSCDTFQGV